MNWIPVVMVVVVVLATIGLGIYATRISRTASDFFVAGRSVNVFWNASAISGEYLSAASFMGVAGLVMKYGYDALWQPVGFATGYLFLLLFIAGPLRRFGAYTIPDFAEGRFTSRAFRKIAVTFVLFIGFFYTMPQMKGAGLTMGTILHTPYWVGVVTVGLVIAFNVALGGMKGITFVQAFQYWLKMFAIAVPVFVLMAVFGPYNQFVARAQSDPSAYPAYREEFAQTYIGGDKEKGFVALPPVDGYRLRFDSDAYVRKIGPAVKPGTTSPAIPATAFVRGPLENRDVSGGHSAIFWPAGTVAKFGPATLPDGKRYAPRLEFDQNTNVSFLIGQPVVGSATNETWLKPFGAFTNKYGFPLLYTLSMIIGLIFGTAGLPHILVRFYTNPDGRAARRTTLWVMVLIGVFYIFPAIWGAMGRELVPHLYTMPKGTDTVVLQLPLKLGGAWGAVWQGVTSAGAFAAFMSTFSGLLVSMSGALAHDIYGTILRPQSTSAERLTAFRVAALAIGGLATALGLVAESWDIAMLVTWAFAIAAASYFPLLLLGSWWRGLTMKGAATGMLVGGLASLGAIVTTMLIDKKMLGWSPEPIVRTLMEQPAIWAVPLSLGLMWLVSSATRNEVPKDVDSLMLRLHAPEELGLSKNYIAEH